MCTDHTENWTTCCSLAIGMGLGPSLDLLPLQGARGDVINQLKRLLEHEHQMLISQ